MKVRAPPTDLVISRLLPDPVGLDTELEEVTLRNAGEEAVSLEGWGLRDRAGNESSLSGLGALAPGEEITFVRQGQRMSLNYFGDGVVLLDADGKERARVEYGPVAEGEEVVDRALGSHDLSASYGRWERNGYSLVQRRARPPPSRLTLRRSGFVHVEVTPMRFRPYRNGPGEAERLTREIADLSELRAVVRGECGRRVALEEISVRARPDGDGLLGWETHVVSVRGFGPVGYVDGPVPLLEHAPTFEDDGYRTHEDRGWHFAVSRGRSSGYVAWAKREPILGPFVFGDPSVGSYAFAPTEAEALSELKDEVFGG